MELDDAEEHEVMSATVADLVDAITARAAGTGDAGRPIFTTTSPEWWVGDRTFGGMVVAQALHAAIQTARPGVDVHSLHGYFLRPTPPGAETTHVVELVRDGRSFSTRQVTSQVEGKDTFRLTCSFHASEEGDEYQLPMESDVPTPNDVEGFEAPFPFDVRELGVTERRADGTFQSTRRCWFRTREPLPDDPAMHACLLTYFSDMTGASFRPLSLGTWGTHTDASLDHAVWFHRPGRADTWNLFDIHTVVNAGGRAAIRATMHGEDGTLHLSMAQELLIRKLETPLVFETPPWLERAEGGDDRGAA
ncbi:MAG TPA: acyl-CoA thioesterase domain-containing protein [Acidimicrobiales bacterium]